MEPIIKGRGGQGEGEGANGREERTGEGCEVGIFNYFWLFCFLNFDENMQIFVPFSFLPDISSSLRLAIT